MWDGDEEVPDVPVENELERQAVRRFLERQAAARAARAARNTELRPSSHQYKSPAPHKSSSHHAAKFQGYASRYGSGSEPKPWNPSTSTFHPRRPPPRRFEEDLAAKYRQMVELRRQASLDETVRIDQDFRPEVAKLLQGFKARCRNRVRDMSSVHKVWRKIERDLPAKEEEEETDDDNDDNDDNDGKEGNYRYGGGYHHGDRATSKDVFGAGSGKWIQRQRVARRRQERVKEQTTLRASSAPASSAHHRAPPRPSWNASTIPSRTVDGAISPPRRSSRRGRGRGNNNSEDADSSGEREDGRRGDVSLDTLREFRATNDPSAADALLSAIKQTLDNLEVCW